jgi:hypothetical protein
MSTISASTTSTTAYKVTADTTGTLVLQTGATPTTALTIDASQNTTFAGTVADSTGTLRPLVSGTAVASTSGTSIDFTGIPSWVKRITVQFSGVSTNGTSIPIIQLGTGSTTYTTSGYIGSAATNGTIINPTTGIGLSGVGSALYTRSGIITITNISANTWVGSGVLGESAGANINYMGATISLAATLTAVRITTTNGTDAYDAGSINLLWE